MRKTFLILASIALTTGCASIVSKSEYPVSVNSDPEGASFTINNGAGSTEVTGTTPEVVTLKAGRGYFKQESYEIRVSKDGYEDQSYALHPRIDGWYWGNLVIGGFIGLLIVDPLTGAMYKLPERVDISLDGQLAASQQSVD